MIDSVTGVSSMPPTCQPAHAMPSARPKRRENHREIVTGIVTANMILPNPIAARSRYICHNVETLASSSTHSASTTMPIASRRTTPKRRIARPPTISSGALSQNAETMPPVAARLQPNSRVSGVTNSTKL